jgi:hypothetical protein
MPRWQTGGVFMREIDSPFRLIIFLYAAAIFAVIFFLDRLEFSSNAIIAVACFLVIGGLAMMLRHHLSGNSN